MQGLKATLFTPVAVVFATVMVVVFIAVLMAQNSIDNEVKSTVSTYAKENEDSIKDRLSIFEETLRAGVGLFAGNPSVTSKQWQQFISTSAVIERYPGAESVGYVQVVKKDDLNTFVEKVRQSGNTSYIVRPSGERDEYAPVVFNAPPSKLSNTILGVDLYSEQTRKRSLLHARDTGEIALTEAVDSLVDVDQRNKTFLMFMPQYRTGAKVDNVEERRAAVEGYLYTVFRVDNFMSSVANDEGMNGIAFAMSMGSSKETLFKTKNYNALAEHTHETKTSELSLDGTKLHLTYIYDRKEILPGYLTSRPIAILVFGSVTALLIAVALLLVLRGKANELLLEQERGINEAKDNLLSLASHQLRTPATGVKQYIGLILQGFAGKVSQQQKEILEKAYAGNERQLKTINDVLYLARLGSGRIVLSKSLFSPARLVKDIIHELDSDIREKKHKVTVKIPKHQRMAYGDEHMIRMAVENLITNAIKYTHPGGKILVQLIFGKDLAIMVRDNGLGIPADQQSRMFKQFERIDNELSVSVGGSGIGLFVVQNIIEMHGGHIEVSSELNKGSEFRLVMPYGLPPENDKV